MVLLNPTDPVYENRLLSIDATFQGKFEAVLFDYDDLINLNNMSKTRKAEVLNRLYKNVVIPEGDLDG